MQIPAYLDDQETSIESIAITSWEYGDEPRTLVVWCGVQEYEIKNLTPYWGGVIGGLLGIDWDQREREAELLDYFTEEELDFHSPEFIQSQLKERKETRKAISKSYERWSATQLAKSLRTDGMSFRSIAAELNTRGMKGERGGKWYGSTVKAILDKYTQK